MEPKRKGDNLQFELNNREVKESSDGYGMQLRGISPTDYAGLSEWLPLEPLSEIFKDYFASQVTRGIKVKDENLLNAIASVAAGAASLAHKDSLSIKLDFNSK